MKIDVKTKKNFQTQLNRLFEAYGEEFAQLNNLDEASLSFCDFIDSFTEAETVADVSADSSSNVTHKDIRTLMNEMPKAHKKLIALNKIYYELNKKYGFYTANDWLQHEWTKASYLHDADTSSYIHYCYKPEEMLTVKYNDKIYTLTFAELYDMVNEAEQYDETILQNAKFPKNLYVRDVNNNIVDFSTQIKRIVKHNNVKPMHFIKVGNGLSQIVTEDHPIITARGEISAKDVMVGDKLFTCQAYYHDKDNILPTEDNPYTKDFGWLVGMCLAEGCAQPYAIIIKQNEKAQYQKLVNLLTKFNMPFSEDDDNRIRIKVSPLEKILNNMIIGKTAAFKALPIDYCDYPDEFMDGVIAGLIDGDGTLDGYKKRHCQIRIASEELCHQVSNYLSKKNIFCSDRVPYKHTSSNSFEQKLPLFGVGFTLTNEEYFKNIGCIKIQEHYIPLQRKGNFKNKKYVNEYGWSAVIENSQYIDSCPIVYDITTTTGHFLCNNILSHNCYAYDLKDLAERGLYFLDNFNAQPPQHLPTFVDFIKEFISFTSNRSSGAVGLPNLIPYMYYFWRKDCQEGYATKSPEYHARQQIQRFIYAVNQPYVRDSVQSAFTNVSMFDECYLEALFGGAEFPDGTFMIDELDEIKEFQKIFLEVVADIHNDNMCTFPVLSISLLRKDRKFQDEDFARYAVKHVCEINYAHNRHQISGWYDSNFFIDDSVTSLSNCCRLKSDIKDLGYFNSIGGTALRVGSVKVSTINLARLALENHTEDDYIAELEKITLLDCKVLDVVRHIIKRNVEKHLLPNFSKGLVSFDTLYNTIGVIGIYEAIKTFGYIRMDEFGNTYYTEEADNFAKRIIL